MSSKLLILIYGHAASGKTTTAVRLAEHTRYPLLTKDDLQEIIYDKLGIGDSDWQKKTAATAYRLLDHFLHQLMQTDSSVIIEGNLARAYEYERFRHLEQKFGYRIIQIRCGGNGEILLQRLIERAHEPTRHPGHNDLAKLEALKEVYKNPFPEALSADWPLLDIDTTQADTPATKIMEDIFKFLEFQA